MIKFFRRFGFPTFKRTRKHSARSMQKSFHTEPLEPKQLLAADLGFEVEDTSSIARFALFHALSRGRTSMASQLQAIDDSQANVLVSDSTANRVVTNESIASPVSVAAATINTPVADSTPVIAEPGIAEPVVVQSPVIVQPAVAPAITTPTELADVELEPVVAVPAVAEAPVFTPVAPVTTTTNQLSNVVAEAVLSSDEVANDEVSEVTVQSNNAEGSSHEIEILIGEHQGNTTEVPIFVVYNSDTGELRVDASENGESATLTTLEIVSNSAIFTGDPAINLSTDTGFDVDTDEKIFKISAGGFSTLTFGEVAQTGLTEEQIKRDLVISGSKTGDERILSSDDVHITVSVQQNGSPVTDVQVGSQFDVVFEVEDKSFGSAETQQGVFAAYMDVLFDTNAVSVTPEEINYGNRYPNGQSFTFDANGIDEVGAFAETTPLGGEAFELFRFTATATQAGVLTFETDPADNLPLSDTLLFGVGAPIDVNRIDYGSASVNVTDTPEDLDLVAFAQALTDSGAIFYGASWCPHCTDQKELFDDGQEFLPFVEVTTYETSSSFNSLNQVGIDNNISSFPTWVFADGSRAEGLQTLQELSTKSGIAIPTTNVPTLIGLEDVTVNEGSPLHIPLNGWDANGGELTYTVTSDNPAVLATELVDGGRSLLIDVNGENNGGGSYGKMLFQLFEDKVPRVTDAIIDLAQNGIYDDVIFHRVINGFMIQGGDPTGTGFGDPDLPRFDDQFHVDLQHNRTGVLSMAKSQDDTNSSQFFITEVVTRNLDFNHSVFGQLVEGDKNREAISNAFTTTNPETGAGDFPSLPVRMESVTVFDDIENGMVLLRALDTQGTANVTVTVSDQEGHSFEQTFAVTVQEDDDNALPFLLDIPELSTTANTPLQVNLEGIDEEGDSIFFGGNVSEGTTQYEFVTNDSATGEITITPPQDFIGVLQADFFAGVSANSSDADSVVDYQRNVEITVNPATPVVDLLISSDTGLSTNDDITNAQVLEFGISNLQDGTTVELFSVDGSVETKIGEAVGSTAGVTIQVDTLINGDHEIIARQQSNGLISADSASLFVTVDRQDLAAFTSTAPSSARANELLSYDANHPIEGNTDIAYSLVNGPTGATIDAVTGELQWTPSDAQVGDNDFSIQVSDLAGNVATQSVSVNVSPDDLISVRFELTDATTGNPIQATRIGTQYVLNAYVDDLRTTSDGGNLGVTSAFFDVEFNGSITSVVGSLQFSNDYDLNQNEDLTVAGLFDETGATSSQANLGNDEVLVWTAVMTADAVGTVTFAGNLAESNDFALADFTGSFDPSKVVFTDASIELVDFLFAQDDTVSVDEDSGTTTVDVLSNDLPADNSGVVTVINVSNPTNGSTAISSGGTAIEYTPDADFSGTDSFTYTVQDEQSAESQATVTVNVAGSNDAPVAVADTFDIVEDSTDNVLDVLANDTDADGDTLSISSGTSPTNGTVEVSTDGNSLIYTPDADFFGTDSFQYSVNDGTVDSADQTVTINISAVNDPPVASADTLSGQEDVALTIDVSELLSNDTAGANETSDTLTLTSVANAQNGSVNLVGSQITFTPDADFNGVASFDYTIEDDSAAQDTGSVTINIAAVNDVPTAVDDAISTPQSAGTITLDVLANDSSAPDGNETLTIQSVTDPSQGGTVSIDGNQLLYTPPEGLSGVETFDYVVSDGELTNTATVSVSVENFVPGGVKGNVTAGGTHNALSTSIRIVGTDFNGNAIDQTIKSGTDGSFAFDEVSAGNYTVSTNLPFTLSNGGSNEVDIEVGSGGLGDQTIELADSYINPKFAMWEMIASATRDGVYAAVDTEGGDLWTRNLDGWDADIVDMAFSDDMETLTITISDDGGNQQSADIPVDDRERMRIIGAEDSARLVRILGPQSAFFTGG